MHLGRVGVERGVLYALLVLTHLFRVPNRLFYSIVRCWCFIVRCFVILSCVDHCCNRVSSLFLAMDSRQKTTLLDLQDGVTGENIDGRDERLPKSGHLSLIQVKTEVVDDSGNNEGKSSDSQREIELLKNEITQQNEEIRSLTRMVIGQFEQDDESKKRIKELEDALKQKDDELGVMRRMLAERIVRGDGGNKRKLDGSSGSGKKKPARGESKKTGKLGEEKYCSLCRSCHSGHCSKRTRKCNNCGEIGHEITGCRNPPLCFNCMELGHISAGCPKEKRTKPIFHSCGELGHINRECPKGKGEK